MGLRGCLSIGKREFGLCCCAAGCGVSEAGTRVETFGALGFYIIVSLLTYGFATANGSLWMNVIGTQSKGSVRGRLWVWGSS